MLFRSCAFALVQCRNLTEADLLAHLIGPFADGDKAVRAEVARAVEQIGSPSASLLLRLRANLGKDEEEVLGACYAGVLRIEGPRAIAWAEHFLDTADDCAGEAALAIAHTFSGGLQRAAFAPGARLGSVVSLSAAVGHCADSSRCRHGISV